MLTYKRYSSFCSAFIPKITFESRKTHNNLVAFLVENDLKNPPQLFQKVLTADSPITSDLTNLKSAWLYGLPGHDANFKRALLMYGKIDETKPDYRKSLYGLGSKATRTLLANKITDVDLFFSNHISEENLAIIMNALLLANYKYEKKSSLKQETEENGNAKAHPATDALSSVEQTDLKKFKPIANFNIVNPNLRQLGDYPNFLVNTAKYSLMARNLANERADVATTLYMVEKAKEIAKNHPKISITTIVGEELKEKGLNLLYSVGKGSVSPPALVCLKYEGNPSNKDNVIALVGKGIVFDAGGLNIKPSGSMEDMFIDKSGACNVLATLKGVAEMNLPINLVVTIALAENYLGNNCYRPSDIITSLKGLTVEIGNTDAEGRLILADAMTWTQQNHKVESLIELSTLTGACMIALGEEMGGLFSNNDALARNLAKVGDIVNEPFWRLPITDEHRETMKSAHADLNNAGKSRYGGASKGAAFLENFVEKGVKWAHLDIAGPAESRGDKGLYAAGGTGFSVRLLLNYLRDKALQDKALFIEKEN